MEKNDNLVGKRVILRCRRYIRDLSGLIGTVTGPYRCSWNPLANLTVLVEDLGPQDGLVWPIKLSINESDVEVANRENLRRLESRLERRISSLENRINHLQGTGRDRYISLCRAQLRRARWMFEKVRDEIEAVEYLEGQTVKEGVG